MKENIFRSKMTVIVENRNVQFMWSCTNDKMVNHEMEEELHGE